MLQKIKKYAKPLILIGVGVLNIIIAVVTPGSFFDWLSYLAAGFSFGSAMWHGFYMRSMSRRDVIIESREETIYRQRRTINELRKWNNELINKQ